MPQPHVLSGLGGLRDDIGAKSGFRTSAPNLRIPNLFLLKVLLCSIMQATVICFSVLFIKANLLDSTKQFTMPLRIRTNNNSPQ
jgi:hypothetical protein